MGRKIKVSITYRVFALLLLVIPLLAFAQGSPSTGDRELFKEAWDSARSGKRDRFEELGDSLEGYLLYPYWQYEDYRHRRASVPSAEMMAFLDAHRDWAFTSGLEQAWLKSLALKGRWKELAKFGSVARGAELQCYYQRARIKTGDSDGVLEKAQGLWAHGRSQPDACDPLFAWLVDQDGVTTDLAWERIRLAMMAGNPRLTIYLSRFLPPQDRDLLERWQRLNRNAYKDLYRATGWQDNERTRMITAMSLGRLARHDSRAAMEAFEKLDPHYLWGPDVRGDVMREIALMGAVDLEPATADFLRKVPREHVNSQLTEWWIRLSLSMQDWQSVLDKVAWLPPETASDDRWRYWQARALLELGRGEEAVPALEELASSANYYGFLAADLMGLPYTICPIEPEVAETEVRRLAVQEDFARSIELRRAGIDNWALAEWNAAVSRLDSGDLRAAASLARGEGWYDRTIFALGNSGDLRWYDWRFPLLWEEPVMAASDQHKLDPAWVLGVMRSESAMTESARSSAGAMGLMQVTPATAKQISRQHGLNYSGSSVLLDGNTNIRFGTVYMRQLLDEFRQNPVLVSGAYNAGPNAVNRWLKTRDGDDTTIWVETLPYYETRDYIPRVLAFTTIYDWRMGNDVQRVGVRMPGIESGNMTVSGTTEVVCRADRQDLALNR